MEFRATSGFGGHFEFSDLNRFLTGSWASKVLMVHIFVIRRAKSIKQDTFLDNFAKFAKKYNFGGHIEFLTHHFIPKLMT